jgi:uncharacterized protein (TIGR02594 family)
MTELDYMKYAKGLIGTREIAGKKHSPIIIGWLKKLKSWVVDDETAWCGTFAAHIAQQFGFALPAKWLSARGWLDFGLGTKPGYGTILVFWRGSKAGWQGHVGFYVGEDDTHYHVLGGNQNDSVSISRMPKTRLLGARSPFSPSTQVRRLDHPVVRLSAKGAPVSTSEA